MKRRLLVRGFVCATAIAGMAVAARADGDAGRGERTFEQCATCHTLERGVNNVGPSLFGVFGRKAADVADFRYSPALKRSGIIWTPQTLSDFIADPQQAVPGNRMPFSGVPDAGDRADLIAYLQKVAK
jgi:cytochrome c